MSLFMILAIVLFLAWIGGVVVAHVASGLIHLLLVVAVVSIVLHFVRGTARA